MNVTVALKQAMDLKHTHGTNIAAIRACYNEDGNDLLAVAGEDTVQVLQCVSTPQLCQTVAHPLSYGSLRMPLNNWLSSMSDPK